MEVDATPVAVLDSTDNKRQRDEETLAESFNEGALPTVDSNRHPLWKTSLCSYFRKGVSCSHGDSCRYAHGEDELRQKPDSSWDPTSLRAKKIPKLDQQAEDPPSPLVVDTTTLDKCLIGLPKSWASDNLKSFLDDQGISYKTAKKRKGMNLGFVDFESVDQVETAIEVLNEKSTGGKQIKIADANRRSYVKKSTNEFSINQIGDPTEDQSGVEGSVSKARNARDVVTPLAYMTYSEQLEHKKDSLSKTLKRLTRNARKACPRGAPFPDWILKSSENGGLPCKLEGILESPMVNAYRNKCEFSVGYSLHGKITVGFNLGNFREGVMAVEEPINCPNVSRIAHNFASIFQGFLQSSALPIWNRTDNTGFWRQFTVREGRDPNKLAAADSLESIAEVMLIIQVCSLGTDEELMRNELIKMAKDLAEGAVACSPPLPITTIVVQDHKGISNAAPDDCPLILLPIPMVEGYSGKPCPTEARIHDYISNLRFCISPTAFFQVNTLAAERLYSLAGDWADLSSDTLLFDICCGTGTIGLTLAHRVGMVVGIEMNASAVSDAQRNAEINGINNCKFICGKAENVMGALLKEYVDFPQQHGLKTAASSELIPQACLEDKSDNIMEISGETNDSFEGKEHTENGKENDSIASCTNEGSNKEIVERPSGVLNGCTEELIRSNQEISECIESGQEENVTFEDRKVEDTKLVRQFKNVVVIVDPPRVGLHPVVIKVLRTNPSLRRLVYISCNPESLVANAIELCTPIPEIAPEKGKGCRGWRGMSSAGLARQRLKSMPNSDPFRPVRAVAVDIFPHTPHCELVMLLER